MFVTDCCPSAERLSQLALGQLPLEEVGLLEEHLTWCSHCAGALAGQSAEDELVRAMRGRSPILCTAAEPEVRELIGRVRRLRPPVDPPDADGPNAAAHPLPAEGAIGHAGRYRVLGVLGRGGMGVVYRALDTRLKRQVAIKMILARGGPSAERLARFRREAEVVARLEHPNIVELYEVGEHESDGQLLPYLVMPVVEGNSLAQALAARPLEPQPAVELVERLARAVHYAHGQGVIHRDLKPANVLLPAGDAASAAVKITDFGLAKQLKQEGATDATFDTHADAILGTPNYMAPEQVPPGSGDIGPAADVYALGAILYESLTGRPPFQAAGVLEILDQVRNAEPVPPGLLRPGLPRDVQTVCLKCLAKDARRRYGSADELAADLGRVRRGEPIRARPVPAWERARKWVGRNRLVAALVAVSATAVLTVVLGLIVYQARLRREVKRAEDSAQEAKREQRRSAAQYRAAREALTKMLERVNQRSGSGVPELKQLQREQLEAALAYYRTVFEQADAHEAPVRLDVALAHRQAGDAQQVLGRRPEARENLQKACRLLEGLAEEFPEEVEYRAHLGNTLNNLAMLDWGLKDIAAAERGLLRAVELFEWVIGRVPSDAEFRENLAQCHHNLGLIFQMTGRPSLERYEKALRLCQQLVREHPESDAFAVATAEEHVHIGLLYQHDGAHTPEQAERVYQEAERLLLPAVRRHPEKLTYATSLASLYINWASLLGGSGSAPRKLERATAALDLLTAVLKQEPALSAALENRLPAHGLRAEALEALQRYGEAADDWARVVQLSAPAERPGYRQSLIEVLLRAGQHARAAAEAEELLKEGERKGETLYFAATVYARAAQPDGRPPGVERYAAEAVRLLDEANRNGHFKDPKQVLRLTFDPHLGPVRGRADFKRLLESVGK